MNLPEYISRIFQKPQPPAQQPPMAASLPAPNTSAVARRISLIEELRGKLAKDCHEYGHDIARKSGRRNADQAVLKALEGLAESKAREIADTISQNALDKLLRDLKGWEQMLEQRVLDRDGAATRLHSARQALAALPEAGAYPVLPALTLHGCTIWLTGSLSPTGHDLLSGFDPETRWMLGIAIAYAISVAIVNGILPSSQADLGAPITESRYHGGLIAGVVLGIAFLGLRLANARTNGDMMLAGALALMEFGAVVLVERRAKPLFAEVEAWRARASGRSVAAAAIVVAKLDFDNRQGLVESAERSIAEIEDGLERAHAASDSKSLTTIGVNAMRAGYMKGIAENAAILGGAV